MPNIFNGITIYKLNIANTVRIRMVLSGPLGRTVLELMERYSLIPRRKFLRNILQLLYTIVFQISEQDKDGLFEPIRLALARNLSRALLVYG